VVEVLNHQLDNLRLVVDIVVLGKGLTIALSRFELDDTAVSLLPQISQGSANTRGHRHYLERALLESSLEIVGLTGEDDLVQVEMVRAADEFAIRELFALVKPTE
jgi:hypothetical protein